MFKKISKMRARNQTLVAIVIAFAVIAFWRGVWGLMDYHLFPENLWLSSWVSIAIGIGILGITHYSMLLKMVR